MMFILAENVKFVNRFGLTLVCWKLLHTLDTGLHVVFWTMSRNIALAIMHRPRRHQIWSH